MFLVVVGERQTYLICVTRKVNAFIWQFLQGNVLTKEQ